MCSYRDFGKKVGHYWYINDKTSWPTPISQHKDVYTANAHTIWCEQADNLSWSKLRNRFWRCSEVYKKAVIAP